MADANLSRVGRGVRYMMLLVVFQRLLNFIINQVRSERLHRTDEILHCLSTTCNR